MPMVFSPSSNDCCLDLTVILSWDGREEPDVEAPFTDFFAQPFGKHVAVNSAPVIVEDGDSYNCYWQMPFRKSARIEVVNQSQRPLRALFYAVDWIRKDSLPEDTIYFCARYRQEFPTKLDPTRPDSEYLILDTNRPEDTDLNQVNWDKWRKHGALNTKFLIKWDGRVYG